VQLHRDRDEFAEAGARLVVIGQGTPEQAANFRDSQEVDLELLVDTDRRAYKAAGAKKATFSELLGPRVVARGVRRSLASGVHQGRTIGHPAQLGGVMLVMPDGSVPYVHLADDASDNPPNEEVLAAVRSATASA
jgi:hypothetical protein